MVRRNRLIALLLAIVMAVSGSVTAWAAELRGESVIDVFKYTEAENLQRELEYMNTACNEVTGPRSNPGDTAGSNVAYDSVMGTGYIYSDQHPEVTDVIGTYTDPDIRIEYSDGEVRREFTIVYYGTASNSEVVIDDESSQYAWIDLLEVEKYPMAKSQQKRIQDVLRFYRTGEKRME